MHLGAKVLGGADAAVLAVQEHTVQRRDAELLHRAAQEDAGVDGHRRRLAGSDCEPVGAGQTSAVEQRIDGELLGPGRRRHQPEFLEVGKLFAGRERRVDGDAARREAEHFLLADGAKVACPEEHDDLIEVVLALDREVHAETGKAEILRDPAGEVVVAVVEIAGREGNRMHALVVDGVHRHGAVIVEAGMEELDLKLEVFVAPEGVIRAEAHVAPLIIGDLRQPCRHLAVRIFERLLGQGLRPRAHVLESEERRCRRGRERRSAPDQEHQRAERRRQGQAAQPDELQRRAAAGKGGGSGLSAGHCVFFMQGDRTGRAEAARRPHHLDRKP